MEVHFTPEQEAQLAEIAHHVGTDPEHLVKDAALRLLEENRRFNEGVQRGIAAAERGDFVNGADVWGNVEKILQQP
jgi:predicted transcriptional regulator